MVSQKDTASLITIIDNCTLLTVTGYVVFITLIQVTDLNLLHKTKHLLKTSLIQENRVNKGENI